MPVKRGTWDTAETGAAHRGEFFQLSLPPHTNKLACCDCGLTHTFEFKMLPTTRGKKGMTLWARIRRDNRATANIRRHKLHRRRKWHIAVFPVKEKR